MRVWVLAAACVAILGGVPAASADEPIPDLPPLPADPGPESLPPLPEGPDGLPGIDPGCVTLTAIPEPAEGTFVTPVVESLQVGVVVAANAAGSAGGFFVVLVRPFDCLISDPDAVPPLPDAPSVPDVPAQPDVPVPEVGFAHSLATIPILP